jgi:trypsin
MKLLFLLLPGLAATDCTSDELDSNFTSRIYGGNSPRKNQFPHAVAIYIGNNRICGGSIIDKFHILTAAYCLTGENTGDVWIWAGASFRVPSCKHGVVIRIATQVCHEDYNAKTRKHDLAVARLEYPLIFRKSIQPIKLYNQRDVPVGTNVYLVGYGRNEISHFPILAWLKFLVMQTMRERDCVASGIGIPNDKGQLCLTKPMSNGMSNVRTVKSFEIFSKSEYDLGRRR